MFDGENRPKWYFYVIIGIMVGLLLTTILSDALIGMGIGLAIALVAYFIPTLRKRKAASSAATTYYDDLVEAARGDKALADRLINFERKSAPEASKERLARLALERWERDRR